MRQFAIVSCRPPGGQDELSCDGEWEGAASTSSFAAYESINGRLAKENEWGYTRILGEFKKLGIRSISRNTVKRILKDAGLDPGPKRGEGTWDAFLGGKGDKSNYAF